MRAPYEVFDVWASKLTLPRPIAIKVRYTATQVYMRETGTFPAGDSFPIPIKTPSVMSICAAAPKSYKLRSAVMLRH